MAMMAVNNTPSDGQPHSLAAIGVCFCQLVKRDKNLLSLLQMEPDAVILDKINDGIV
jgi:hypothetical protein